MDQNKVKFNVDKCKALPQVNKFQLAGADLAPCQFLRRESWSAPCVAFAGWLLEKSPLVCNPQQ